MGGRIVSRHSLFTSDVLPEGFGIRRANLTQVGIAMSGITRSEISAISPCQISFLEESGAKYLTAQRSKPVKGDVGDAGTIWISGVKKPHGIPYCPRIEDHMIISKGDALKGFYEEEFRNGGVWIGRSHNFDGDKRARWIEYDDGKICVNFIKKEDRDMWGDELCRRLKIKEGEVLFDEIKAEGESVLVSVATLPFIETPAPSGR